MYAKVMGESRVSFKHGRKEAVVSKGYDACRDGKVYAVRFYLDGDRDSTQAPNGFKRYKTVDGAQKAAIAYLTK